MTLVPLLRQGPKLCRCSAPVRYKRVRYLGSCFPCQPRPGFASCGDSFAVASGRFHARRSRVTLVVAKLDRLARNLAFLDALQRSKLNFVALDCEHANKAMLQMMMVMAEWEKDQVSARTKAALAAKRERGEKLGAEKPQCQNLTARAMAQGRLLARSQSAIADEAYSDILPDMVAVCGRGHWPTSPTS